MLSAACLQKHRNGTQLDTRNLRRFLIDDSTSRKCEARTVQNKRHLSTSEAFLKVLYEMGRENENFARATLA